MSDVPGGGDGAASGPALPAPADLDPAQLPSRVLIVDDNEAVLRLHARALSMAGFEVLTAASGSAAVAALDSAPFNVILSDIDMPGMDGIALLDQVRLRDVDVPVILITGSPSIESAVQALDRGALRYLTKPTNLTELVKVSRDAVRLHRIAVAKRRAFAVLNGTGPFAGDQAGLSVSLDRTLATMRIAYQPIVSWSARAIVAYEALLRSEEPSLPGPAAVLDAAERLTRVHDLGRRVRELAIRPIGGLPDGVRLFLNLHPLDLLDETLLDRDSPLAAIAGRLTLEVTERTSLDRLRDVRPRITSIRELGFRFALDDFGAGFGGLNSFAVLQPEVVKIDMGLVRGIEREPTKQTLVKTMTRMCSELDIAVIAEGVETPDERDELVRAGCDLMQGYLFARPAPHFAPAVF